MSPTHTTRNGNKRYRYYVCANAQARGWHNCPSPSVPAPEIEQFVVDQIKGVGKDTEIANETLERSRQQREEAIGKLETEKRTLERDLHRHNSELRKLAAEAKRDGVATDRMADLQDRIRETEQRATEVREQIARLSRELVDANEVAEASAMFDPLWETLSAREQGRILQLLI